MGPAQAIRTGFAKSFQFSGRATRAEFWWFAPLWIGVLVLIMATGEPQFLIDYLLRTLSVLQSLLLSMVILMLPIFAAMVRRLRDAAILPGIVWFIPAYLVAAPIAVIALDQLERFGIHSPSRLMPEAVYGLVGYFALFALLMIACLWRSDPNKYGSNHLEVTP